MDHKKAQTSIEYITLLGFLLLLITVFFFQANQQIGAKIIDTTALNAVEQIAATVEEVQRLGPGTRLHVWVNLPPNIVSSIVSDGEVGFTMAAPGGGTTDVIKLVSGSLRGRITLEQGPEKITVEMLDSGLIIIGCGLAIDPQSIARTKQPADSEIFELTVTNACSEGFAGLSAGASGAVSTWIIPTQPAASLNPGQSSGFNATITVPEGTAPGTHYGYITISSNEVYAEVPIAITIPGAVTEDTSPPVITLNSPANGYTSVSRTVTFQYIPADAASGIAGCELIINGAVDQTDSTITEGTVNSFTKVGMTNGAYTWSVNCTDDSPNANDGASAARSLTVSADTVPPTVTLNSPADGYTSVISTVVFQYTPNDVDSAVVSCELIISGVVDQTNSIITEGIINSFAKIGMANGAYVWSVNCTDSASNEGASAARSLTLTVDTTPPAITLNSPADGYRTQSTTATFQYTPDDETSGIANCKLHIDGTLDQTSDAITEGVVNSFTKSGLSTGSHTWHVTCTDDSPQANIGTSTTRTLKMPKAYDGFETNTWTGGWGWAAGWTRSGTTAIVNTGATELTRHARLRRTGAIWRSADTSAMTSPKVDFWLSTAGISGTDRVYFDVSTTGTSWTTLQTWSAVTAYAEYSIDVSAYKSATFYARFMLVGNANSDYAYVDYVTITEG